jgi:hypothetical protein
MNVEIGAESALFPEKEYRNGIFIAVCISWMWGSSTFDSSSLEDNLLGTMALLNF